MGKVRLDTLLADRGLFESRTRAAASVMAGEVLLGAERRRAARPGELVSDDVMVDVAEKQRFVSRGGTKLVNALDALGISVEGRRAVDVGISTGGFTDALLQRGASSVIGIDVAYGEVAWSLRNDPRVVLLERFNARDLSPEALAYAPDLLVADVSFISLTKILPAVLRCMGPVWDGLAMIKPQFEVGKGNVGKGGVVRAPADRRASLVSVGSCAVSLGASVLAYASSGLPGPKGNRETFVWLAEGGREGAVADLEAAALAADPGS